MPSCEGCGQRWCNCPESLESDLERIEELETKLCRTEAALARCREQRDYFMCEIEWASKGAKEERTKRIDAELDAILEGD